MMGARAQPKARGQKILPLENHNVKLMSLGLIAGENAPIIWRGPIVGKMISAIYDRRDMGRARLSRGRFAPPARAMHNSPLAQTVPLAGAVIVTTPQNVALEDVHRSIEMFHKVEVPILGIIENMSYFSCPCCGDRTPLFGADGGRQIADAFGLPLLGQIPIQPDICERGDAGMPLRWMETMWFAEIAACVVEALRERESDLPEIALLRQQSVACGPILVPSDEGRRMADSQRSGACREGRNALHLRSGAKITPFADFKRDTNERNYIEYSDALTDLPKKEQALLMGRALRGAVEYRMVQVEEEIREGQGYLEQYEKKYGLSFQAYEKKSMT